MVLIRLGVGWGTWVHSGFQLQSSVLIGGGQLPLPEKGGTVAVLEYVEEVVGVSDVAASSGEIAVVDLPRSLFMLWED